MVNDYDYDVSSNQFQMAERSRQEEKPEEKKTPEQIEKEEQERKERYMQNPVGALIEELLVSIDD